MRQTPQTFSNPLLQGMRTPGLAASEQQRAMRLEDAYEAIGRIANAVREVGGRRKSLVFLTEGSSIGGSITTSASLSGDTTGAMIDALAAASVADLAVYPMNPAGLDLPTDRMIEGFTRQVDTASEGNTRGFGGREIAHDDLSNINHAVHAGQEPAARPGGPDRRRLAGRHQRPRRGRGPRAARCQRLLRASATSPTRK